MREKLAKLIDVKSIITILLVGTFIYRNINGDISDEQFMTIFTTVIAFYFGTQYGKIK